MKEKEKMGLGIWYDANFDEELAIDRENIKTLCQQYNFTPIKEVDTLNNLLKKMIPHMGKNITILPTLWLDYGYNLYLGDNVFINHNVYLMDCAKITIGSNVFIGPNFNAYTAIHPLLAKDRNKGYEVAKPISIGSNVWIAGDVTILPGVTIGDNVVIGAKSLVTKDIPEGYLAYGNPAKPIRKLTELDSIEEELNKIKETYK